MVFLFSALTRAEVALSFSEAAQGYSFPFQINKEKQIDIQTYWEKLVSGNFNNIDISKLKRVVGSEKIYIVVAEADIKRAKRARDLLVKHLPENQLEIITLNNDLKSKVSDLDLSATHPEKKQNLLQKHKIRRSDWVVGVSAATLKGATVASTMYLSMGISPALIATVFSLQVVTNSILYVGSPILYREFISRNFRSRDNSISESHAIARRELITMISESISRTIPTVLKMGIQLLSFENIPTKVSTWLAKTVSSSYYSEKRSRLTAKGELTRATSIWWKLNKNLISSSILLGSYLSIGKLSLATFGGASLGLSTTISIGVSGLVTYLTLKHTNLVENISQKQQRLLDKVFMTFDKKTYCRSLF